MWLEVGSQQFLRYPNMVSQSRSHCRGAFNRLAGVRRVDLQGFVRAAEIVKGRGQGHGMLKVRQFLGKARGKAGEPFIEVAQGKVEPLCVRR